MLISPPFLPQRQDNQTEDAWLNNAMQAVPGEGMYPVGSNMCWHGGIHLIAPAAAQAGQTLPARAIADGIVVFKRIGDAGPSNDPSHLLNYEGWTSNGVVVIQHDTEIGASAQDQATAVRFYSIYMHLTNIPATVQQGKTIYRKDTLGQAGYIRGTPNRIHFEITCDDANLQNLIGRQTGDLPTAQDGRIDVVFGELYFQMPAGTPIYGQQPLDNNPVAHIQPSAGSPQALAPIASPDFNWIVGMRYAGGQGPVNARGNLVVSTYRENGDECGTRTDSEYEYNLYTRANAISNAYPAANRPAPSAVYELLRFGRIINTAHETLTPNNVPHWRQIILPSAVGMGAQLGWVNLNNLAAGQEVRKYSDADFPHWKGWRILNDDLTATDSRCDSEAIKTLLDEDGDHHVSPQERANRMQQDSVKKQLSYAICSMPSEWNSSDVDARWSWLQESTPENPQALDAENYSGFHNHVAALCFAAPALQTATRRFHPRMFIEVFRQCGWLSANELASTLPKYLFYRETGNPRTAITTNNQIYTLTSQQALSRFANHALVLNFCIRKYIGSSVRRMALFMAQVVLETAQWRDLGGSRRLMHEWGFGAQSTANPATQYYSAFYGRGIMQLTWAGNYKSYGEFRMLPNHQGAYAERLTPVSPRITATSQHYLFNPNDGGTISVWSPRYDPDIVGENPYAACDSGGFYWVSKKHSGAENINRISDHDYSTVNVGLINRLVNGGGNGYYERQAYSVYLLRILGDDAAAENEVLLSLPAPKNNIRVNFARPE